ncbi:hypothetical protein TRFO_26771 [Tritrichomonas foetus]|uniref:SEP domain-containing protein n=1 Tax=Tritrichomonas foetus TaxID=1144522 RepID=A0A1J4K2S4_9EUKA|nr:hypothetical protein TRFO_26771 [Tritrichomonas foetus]|eukprot:OHT05499.1 hypothetical protein TRFO_26771 [Tritrichomonas foetus]
MSDKYKAQGANKLAKVPLGVPAKKAQPKKVVKKEIDYPKKIAELQKVADERQKMIDELNEQITSQRKDSDALFKQITEMKQFLADYGFQWVGGPAPVFGSFPNGPIDMTVFMQRVEDLNKLADSNKKISDKNGVKGLHQVKIMKLVLLNDGFTVNNGPLRIYTENNNGMFIQDIMDGYFPGEFKGEFPDGVKFSVDDQRSLDIFKGTPRRLLESARSLRLDKEEDEIGEGDGKLKVKFPDGNVTVINTKGENKVRQIRRLIVNNFVINDRFELCSLPSTEFLKDEATLESLGLYPRGIVLVSVCKQ